MSDYAETADRSYAPDFFKDPDSTLDYAFNWSIDLDGDTISTSTFYLPDGLTQVSTNVDGDKTAIFVSGGESGGTYRITNRITTAGGRTFDKTIRIYVKEL